MFRVKYTEPDGIWWTMATGWVEASLVVSACRARGFGADVFAENRRLTAEVDAYFRGATAEQVKTGRPQIGVFRISCACGKCQPFAVAIVRVPDRPVAVASIKVLIADDETPRDLAGPTDAEVRGCDGAPDETRRPAKPNPLIVPFDVHHAEREAHRAANPPPTPAAATLSWLDRFIAWLTGSPQGIEVQP